MRTKQLPMNPAPPVIRIVLMIVFIWFLASWGRPHARMWTRKVCPHLQISLQVIHGPTINGVTKCLHNVSRSNSGCLSLFCVQHAMRARRLGRLSKELVFGIEKSKFLSAQSRALDELHYFASSNRPWVRQVVDAIFELVWVASPTSSDAVVHMREAISNIQQLFISHQFT